MAVKLACVYNTSDSGHVCVDRNILTIDLIPRDAIYRVQYLHELFIEYPIHIPIYI